jgi:hypothetical protein
MPELFPSIGVFVLCALVIAGASLIYATVGFGAGMFAIATLAMILPQLADAVATLLLLTLVTEIWVLLHAWRDARGRLLLGLVPTMAIGLWFGTQVLISIDVGLLKRGLGIVVAAAGVWFIISQRKPAAANTAQSPNRNRHTWTSLPAGLISGVLAGMFGTGGPPVIVYLRGYGLAKGAFRATLLWYFLIMSAGRAAVYNHAGVLTTRELWAAAWLLPATALGTVVGMYVHRRLSERQFGLGVSTLLVILGVLLIAGAGS